MSDLRATIREMLEAELASMKSSSSAANVKQEFVTINTDDQLANFVVKVIKLSEDPSSKNQLLEGQHLFKLDTQAAQTQTAAVTKQAAPPEASQAIEIESGLVTEKDVNKLPVDLNLITVGNSVRFTPLASDELRRRRIKIERRTS